MTEKIYWAISFLVAAGILVVGVKFFPPLLSGFHVLVCGLLMLVVLLQSGRAADLAGAFGGAGSQTAFGPRGTATFFSKATTFLAIVFMATSLTLAIFSSSSQATSLAEEPAPSASGQTTPPPAQNPPPQTPPPPQQ